MPRSLDDYLNANFGINNQRGGDGGGDPSGPPPTFTGTPPSTQQPRAGGSPVSTAPLTQMPPVASPPLPGQRGSFQNNPDYEYIPGYGYRYRGYNPSTGAITGTPSVSIPTTAPATSAPFDVNAFGRAWVASGGKTVQDFQNFYNQYPGAASSGWKISGSHGGNLVGPNGQAFDAVISSGTGGTGAWWNPRTGGPSDGGTEFDDPWGSTLESAVTARLNSLMSPENRQAFNEYMSELLGNASRAKGRAQDFATTLGKRIDELNQYPYTSGDEATMRAKTFDSLERRRTQTMKNRLEQSYAHGFAPTSGTNQQVADETNRQFEEQRTGLESNLLHSAISESQRRKDEATQLQGIVQQALAGGDLTALQDMAARAGSETDALTRADARQREILTTIGLPLELENSRIASANSVFNGQPSAGSALDSIFRLFGINNDINRTNAQNSSNNLAGLGQLLAILFPNYR